MSYLLRASDQMLQASGHVIEIRCKLHWSHVGKSNQTSSGKGPPTRSEQLATLPDALGRVLVQPLLSFAFQHLNICGFEGESLWASKKSIQNGLRSLLSFSWSSWQHLSVLPSLWASVDGALVLPEMQLLDRKQADIGSLWPSLAAFSRAYETKLLQVRVRKQGRTWRRTWQEGGKDLSNDLLVRFRICRFQSSKKKNCGYFFVPIVAKKAPAVWCHFSSSRTSRLALKFLKMKLMMKAFYRLEIASRRPQLGADGRGTQAAWWGFQNERRVVCPFLVPISFQTKPRLRVAEQVDLCKFYEGLSLFSEGPRASSKRVPGRVPLTRELGLGYSLVVSLFKFEADMSRCLCYLKQLWSSKYWSPKTIGVSDQGWLWQWQTRLKIKYSIVMFLSWVLVGLVTYFCFKRS